MDIGSTVYEIIGLQSEPDVFLEGIKDLKSTLQSVEVFSKDDFDSFAMLFPVFNRLNQPKAYIYGFKCIEGIQKKFPGIIDESEEELAELLRGSFRNMKSAAAVHALFELLVDIVPTVNFKERSIKKIFSIISSSFPSPIHDKEFGEVKMLQQLFDTIFCSPKFASDAVGLFGQYLINLSNELSAQTAVDGMSQFHRYGVDTLCKHITIVWTTLADTAMNSTNEMLTNASLLGFGELCRNLKIDADAFSVFAMQLLRYCKLRINSLDVQTSKVALGLANSLLCSSKTGVFEVIKFSFKEIASMGYAANSELETTKTLFSFHSMMNTIKNTIGLDFEYNDDTVKEEVCDSAVPLIRHLVKVIDHDELTGKPLQHALGNIAFLMWLMRDPPSDLIGGLIDLMLKKYPMSENALVLLRSIPSEAVAERLLTAFNTALEEKSTDLASCLATTDEQLDPVLEQYEELVDTEMMTPIQFFKVLGYVQGHEVIDKYIGSAIRYMVQEGTWQSFSVVLSLCKKSTVVLNDHANFGDPPLITGLYLSLTDDVSMVTRPIVKKMVEEALESSEARIALTALLLNHHEFFNCASKHLSYLLDCITLPMLRMEMGDKPLPNMFGIAEMLALMVRIEENASDKLHSLGSLSAFISLAIAPKSCYVNELMTALSYLFDTDVTALMSPIHDRVIARIIAVVTSLYVSGVDLDVQCTALIALLVKIELGSREAAFEPIMMNLVENLGSASKYVYDLLALAPDVIINRYIEHFAPSTFLPINEVNIALLSKVFKVQPEKFKHFNQTLKLQTRTLLDHPKRSIREIAQKLRSAVYLA
ncbi:hypothetical protein PCE1_000947 [Barthelona sp. PCE]